MLQNLSFMYWTCSFIHLERVHVGTPRRLIATDFLSRFKRARYNVLHPTGWDAFGLPAEQYAGGYREWPSGITAENITKRQINALGFSNRLGPWSRADRSELLQVDSMDFLTKLLRKGLAYEAEVPVNCWRIGHSYCQRRSSSRWNIWAWGHPAVQTMRQWMLANTAYAALLLELTWMTLTGQSLSRTCNATDW